MLDGSAAAASAVENLVPFSTPREAEEELATEASRKEDLEVFVCLFVFSPDRE